MRNKALTSTTFVGCYNHGILSFLFRSISVLVILLQQQQQQQLGFGRRNGDTTVVLFAAAFSSQQQPSKTSTKSITSGTGFGTPKSPTKSYDIDDSSVIQNLIKYLTTKPTSSSSSSKYKAELDNVVVGIDRGTHKRRGLYTTKTIGASEKILLRIPSDYAIALSDPINNGLDVPTLAHNGANYLRMYRNNPMLYERFQPYFDTLPTFQKGVVDVPPTISTPDYYSDEEIQLFEFPRLIQQIKQRQNDIEMVASETGFDKAELQYATWLVSTRSIPLAVSSNPSTTEDVDVQYDERGQVITKVESERHYIRVFVPFLDIVNHSSNQPNAKFTIIDSHKDDAWFALESLRPIPAGTEITIAYGSTVESSVDLLTNYGFVEPKNPVDKFMLRKGGDDCFTTLKDWTTSLEEDERILQMLNDESSQLSKEDTHLQKILQFRIQLKKSYPKKV